MTYATQSWREAASNVAFALFLTSIMAVALFVSIAFNPKAEGYGNLPWYYAAGCLLTSAAMYILSKRLSK